MPERDIGQEILDGIRGIKTHKKGQIELRTTKLKKPASPKTIQGQTLLH